MSMQEKIVVLYAGQYNVLDDKTGRRSEGVSVSYLYGDSLESLLHPNGSMGQRPAKGSLATEKISQFPAAPALYTGSFDTAIGSDGKPMLKLVDVEFISLVSLEPKKAGKAPAKADPN